jgi:spore germination cell wall hydrolase CwlJ-like protein
MKLAFLLWLASALPQPVSDELCLATTVYLEARSESQVGQMAVAEVAMRRRDTGRWGSSVCAVVRAPGQFATSTMNANYVLNNPEAWHKAWQVADRTMRMWTLPPEQRKFIVPDADHFVLAESVSPGWIKGPPVATIGAHNFYRIN